MKIIDRRQLSHLMISALAVASVGMSGAALADSHLPKSDGAFITLGGEVVERIGSSFRLDHGDGIVTVEMDDWDNFNEALMVNPGETVTVRGRVDDSFYEQRTIEAESVFVAERRAKYFANPVDEEGDQVWSINDVDASQVADGTWIGIAGTVSATDGSRFTIHTDSALAGAFVLEVETAYLTYNPLDDVGYQQIDEGDRVYVTGDLDNRIFANREIEAFNIITLEE